MIATMQRARTYVQQMSSIGFVIWQLQVTQVLGLAMIR